MVETSGGASGAPPLRRLNTPRRVEVRAGENGEPLALKRSGVWLDVLELLDRYRTEDRWWTPEPVARAYYELLLEDGRTATVFRDEIKESWWEQRYQ